MGLCLHVFDRDPGDDDDDEPEELADCDVGHYSDFGYFRDAIGFDTLARDAIRL